MSESDAIAAATRDDGVLTVAVSVSSLGAADPSPRDRLERLGIRLIDNAYGRRLTEDEAIELLQEADGVIAGTEPLTERVLEQAGQLKVISRVGTGLDNVDLECAKRAGIAVFNTPDAVTAAVAELTVGGVLAVLRRTWWMDAELRAGRWSRHMGSLLEGKSVGIVGLGRIGRRVAELLVCFRAEPVGFDVAPDADRAGKAGIRLTELDDLLASADIVTLHVSSGNLEAPLIGQRELELMREGAILVNTARGGLIDEDALCEALEAGSLGGAYLDTFEREPYEGRLASLPNVLLTPHAGSYAREARVRMETEAVNNLLEFLGVTES